MFLTDSTDATTRILPSKLGRIDNARLTRSRCNVRFEVITSDGLVSIFVRSLRLFLGILVAGILLLGLLV